MNRRHALKALAGIGTAAISGCVIQDRPVAAKPWFTISLAQWSLHRAFHSGALDPLDFARIARRQFQIDAVEYVNTFYQRNYSEALVRELKTRADGEGVQSILIMCDDEGRIGDPDATKRGQAAANHHKWADAAKTLGCHSIRVNASSEGTYEDQIKLAADGLIALVEYAAPLDINVIVENHGGLSSNGQWLTAVMKRIDHPRCGTLPDFGNFETYDRYRGITEMMPYAKGVSAKSRDFDAAGNETTIDYRRMLAIVRAAGYSGRLGIEYEGDRMPEPDGIRATKALLERLA